MEHQVLEIIAGFGSSLIFILSNFPMVFKAVRTHDLKSYSFSQILMANVGNMLYWLYIAGLPLGPIWFLHGFNTTVALLMLTLYIRFELKPKLVFFGRESWLKAAVTVKNWAKNEQVLTWILTSGRP